MRFTRRAGLLLATLILAALLSPPARGEVRLEGLRVALWPEYDRPEVLVIISGWLSPDTPLPALVPLPMPAAAGEPHAVAKRASDGDLLVAQHTVDVAGPVATVGVLTDVPEVRLEYYIAASRADDLRSYRFDWPGGLEVVGEIAFEILEPRGADGMIVTPSAVAVPGPGGLTYHRGRLGPLPAGGSFSITFAYVKSGSDLVAGAAPPGPAGAEPAAAPTPAEQTSFWLSLAIVLPVLVIVLVVALRWLRAAPPAEG